MVVLKPRNRRGLVNGLVNNQKGCCVPLVKGGCRASDRGIIPTLSKPHLKYHPLKVNRPTANGRRAVLPGRGSPKQNYSVPCKRGSRASRRPSPRKVKASTTRATQIAGVISTQGWALIADWPSSRREPQLVMKMSFGLVEGRSPRPRYPRMASVMIIAGNGESRLDDDRSQAVR